MARLAFKKISAGAKFAKIKWDENKHKRDQMTGKFKHKPGTEELKAEPFGVGKATGFKSADVIKLHVKANPKKPGTAAATDLAKYKDSMTVAEFKAAVGDKAQGHLVHDTKKGFITIHDPTKLKAGEAAGAGKPTAAPTGQPAPQPSPAASAAPALKQADYVITSKTSKVKPDDVIKLHAPTNPKKTGSKAATDLDKYKDEMTVNDLYTAVGDKGAAQGHILHDLKKGYISVHAKADLDAMQSGARSPGQLAAEMKAGDAKLGVLTENPYNPGKNHDDFEATAKKLGLKTPTSTEAGPPVTEPPGKPGSVGKYEDNDVVETYLGNKYTIAQYKKNHGLDDAGVTNEINSGDLKLMPKPMEAKAAASLKFADDDNITFSSGTTYSVSELKVMGYKEETITSAVASGKWKHTVGVAKKPEAAPAPAAKFKDDDIITTSTGMTKTVAKMKADSGYTQTEIEAKVAKGIWSVKPGTVSPPAATAYKDEDMIYLPGPNSSLTVKDLKSMKYSDTDIDKQVKGGTWVHKPANAEPPKVDPATTPPSEYATHTVVLTAKVNPYPSGSPEWHKYKSMAYAQKINQSMSLTGWYTHTTALNATQKQAALKKMLDDGHITIITPAQTVQMHQQQAVKFTKPPAHSADPNFDAHIEQVKPANWEDATDKWNKAAGSAYKNDILRQAQHGSYLSKTSPQWQTIIETREASGLYFNSSDNTAVEWYTGSGSSDANNILRHKGFESLSPSQKTRVKSLDNIMMAAQDDIIMWRGIGSSHKHGEKKHLNSNNMPPPTEFTDMAFSSVSFNPYKASNFAGRSTITGAVKRRTVFKTRIPKGTKAAFIGRNSTEMSGLQDEAEVIIARGTRYKYISTSRDVYLAGDKVDIVEVEIVTNVGGNLPG